MKSRTHGLELLNVSWKHTEWLQSVKGASLLKSCYLNGHEEIDVLNRQSAHASSTTSQFGSTELAFAKASE